VDRAVEVDMAEFVRADIEVNSIDAIRLVETPVRRGLDLRQCGHGIGYSQSAQAAGQLDLWPRAVRWTVLDQSYLLFAPSSEV